MIALAPPTTDEVRVTSPAPRGLWRSVVAQDPDVLLSQTPEWTDCLVAYGGFADASVAYELADGRSLVLPMVRRRGPVGRVAGAASLPAGWGVGGLIGTDGVTPLDVRRVFSDLAGSPGLRTTVRPGPLHAGSWAAARPPGVQVVPRVAHLLDLDGGFDRVWERRFKGAARTAVRKAQRSGLTVECDTTGRLVGVFYELYERSLRRWARQQNEPALLARWRGHRRDPIEKIELLTERLAGACRVWVAWRGTEPAAAILVLQDVNAHYTRGVMDKDIAGPTRANYLLHQLAIEDACAAGCRFYYMGESGNSQSLAQFKTRLGARAVPHAEYCVERLPLTALDSAARGAVKRIIGFRD